MITFSVDGNLPNVTTHVNITKLVSYVVPWSCSTCFGTAHVDWWHFMCLPNAGSQLRSRASCQAAGSIDRRWRSPLRAFWIQIHCSLDYRIRSRSSSIEKEVCVE